MNAIDFGLYYENVTAAAAGVVRLALDDSDGFGMKVEIDHPDTGGYFTLYAHLNYATVSQGQSVSQGQVIGVSGKSGDPTYEPHLHFQLQQGVDARTPEPCLA